MKKIYSLYLEKKRKEEKVFGILIDYIKLFQNKLTLKKKKIFSNFLLFLIP
jgi:hypothetical protein